jgi:hypothetical protein
MITPRPDILLALALEWEIGHRIDEDTWTQAGAPNTNCWYITHAEGKPSKVEEDGIEYEEEPSSIADCNANPGTWHFDSSDNRLYVHTSGDDTPHGNYIVLSYFWDRFGSHAPLILDGKEYRSYLSDSSIPSVTAATSAYHMGGTQQGFGTIKINNADGYFDTRLTDYIYEAKRMRALVGEYTIVDGVFTPASNNSADWLCAWEGWSGNIMWTDEEIEVETEDLRRIMI